MSSRSVRRTFAPAFVVTIACAAPAIAGPEKPGDKNPPPPGRAPAKVEQKWRVTRTPGDPKAKPPRPEQCWAHVPVSCPQPQPGKAVPTCNPPAPLSYACPSGVPDASFTVVLKVGAVACRVDDPPMKCPEDAKCNPPEPRWVACPQ
jgi:hypothetical protein